MKTTLKKILIIIGVLVAIFVFLIALINFMGSRRVADTPSAKETTTEAGTVEGDNAVKSDYDISNYLDVNSEEAFLNDRAGDFCEYIKRTVAAGDYDDLSQFVNMKYLNENGYTINADGIKQGISSVYDPNKQSMYLIGCTSFDGMGEGFPAGQISIVIGTGHGNTDIGAVDYSNKYTLVFQYFLNDDGEIAAFILRDWLDGNMGAKRL